jgi:lysophospholipase L1-like esterase
VGYLHTYGLQIFDEKNPMKTTQRKIRILLAIITLLFASGNLVIAVCNASNRRAVDHWVGTWACAPQLAEATDQFAAENFARDVTLRQIVHVSVGGETIRVRFTNAFAEDAVTIKSAHLAKPAAGGEILPGTDRKLTFNQRDSITIPAGALVYSDPIDFELPRLSELAVTIYVKSLPGGVTTHAGSRATSYFTDGDFVSAVSLPDAKSVDHWYFLSGIDVRSKRERLAVVVLGDSITDGKNSTTNGNFRWPDVFAARLQSDRNTRDVGVLNEGIGGNRLLQDGAGANALARMDRDVLAQVGVGWLIVFEGVNDIGTCKEPCDMESTAKEIIGAYEQIIVRAHSRKIRVYGATITPFGASFYATPEAERTRESVNDWVRTSGWFDAVLDFDRTTRDPNNPQNLLPSFDSGDHLHPGDVGYKAIANSIDLSLFQEK